ncbi:hypothetical protein [Auritidibacter ignavus]|uniref:hypothetical protein n=1 Tax=Auritidibacter ignavus TaxID=678932 RepID=UPI002447FE23|nr:hypothetical protein [Auritidibacter ignavus]WGH84058.1 hypothetical protein QDX20_00440 [Auritidibacter ignavus]
MKVFFGILSLVLGIASMVVSVGLQTVWSPPEERTASIEAPDSEAPLTIITPGIEVEDDETAEYTLTGEGEFTLMLGQRRDIDAWVGDAAHTEITGIDDSGDDPVVTVETVEGESEVPNPVNSDLWMATQTVEGEVTQRWAAPEEGDWALLVATDGTTPAPTELSVTWATDETESPWVTPLMVIGVVLVLIGLILLIWALVSFRSKAKKKPSGRRAAGRAPAREQAQVPAAGESGSGSISTLGRVSAVLVITSMILATTSVLTAQAENTEEPDNAPVESQIDEDASAVPEDAVVPVVFPDQLETILGRINSAVEKGDASENVEDLGHRVQAQARTMRSEIYRNRGIDEEVSSPVPISEDSIQRAWMEPEEQFPRTMMVLTGAEPGQSDEDSQYPQLLTLTQPSAREQYQLVANTPVLDGVEIPAGDLTDTDVTELAEDEDAGAVASPKDALTDVVAYLDDPEADAADRVADNAYTEAIHELQSQEVDAQSENNTEVSHTRSLYNESMTALKLSDGSVLVMGAGSSTTTFTPEEGGTVNVGKVAAGLDDSDNADEEAATDEGEEATAEEDAAGTYSTEVRLKYREQLALLIPAEGEIQLVGYSSSLSETSSE